MTLGERIEVAFWRLRYAWAKRRADIRLAKRDRDRARDFYRRGVLVLALLCAPSLHACAGREIRAESARCRAAIAAASTVEAVEIERERCHERLDRIGR